MIKVKGKIHMNISVATYIDTNVSSSVYNRVDAKLVDEIRDDVWRGIQESMESITFKEEFYEQIR